ncbi:MAG: glycosyltransferase family 2 protein [Pseudomonadota bacterium]
MSETKIADSALITLSVVIPVYNGANYLNRLINEINLLREKWIATSAPVYIAEVVLVDDNAIDESSQIIEELAAANPWVFALHLSRNFGQHSATIAGILHTSGDWIVTMDEDLQHPPEKIPDLFRMALSYGADVVYAKALDGVHSSFIRDWSSRTFKRIVQTLTENQYARDFNSFRLIRGSIARAASSVCSHDTYFDVNVSWFTQRVTVVPMELKDERYLLTGKSGYRLSTLFSHARRMFFSSHVRVLQFGSLIGFAVLSASLLGGFGLFISKLLSPDEIKVAGWTSLMLATMFFGGLTILMVGISLQYLSTLVLRAHGKPVFFTIDRSNDAKIVAFFSKDNP